MASASSRKRGGQSSWAGSGQRAARPPDVQRGDVTMADGLLPASVGADLLYGQIDFDEALGVGGHDGS